MTRVDQHLEPQTGASGNKSEPPIYLDHNSSTPPASEVVEAMLPWLGASHSNPHSEHRGAVRAAAAIEEARASIADLIGADSGDIFFTSGATESNNLILQGLLAHGELPRVLATSTIEHKSVLETAAALHLQGVGVVSLPVDRQGRVDLSFLEGHLKRMAPDAINLVSIMHANNEVGTLQPLDRIAGMTKASGAYFHSDATQSFGKVPIDVTASDVDFMSISAHKVYGPNGIGAVYIAPGLRDRIRPIMYGGGQQGGIRPGTVPVFLAVGFGVASRLAARRLAKDSEHCRKVVEQFVAALKETRLPHQILGDDKNCLPGLLSLRLPGIDAHELVSSLGDTLYASTGSACTSGELKASHVLRAIGLNETESSEVVRLGFGRSTKPTDSIRAAGLIAQMAQRQAADYS